MQLRVAAANHGTAGAPTIWPALGRRGYLLSQWPARAVVYLGTGIPVGLCSLIVLITLAAVGSVFSVILIGIPLLAALLLAGIPLAGIERWRLQLLDPRPIDDPHLPRERTGSMDWAIWRYREQATWRELCYACVFSVLLWPISLAVLCATVALPLAMLYAAATVLCGLNPEVRLLPGWTVHTNEQAGLLVPVAVLVLPLGCYLVGATAAAHAALARLLLGANEGETSERLEQLTQSRTRFVEAFQAERSRIERDLHDGAQQRLVALTMTLALARISEPAEADRLLAQAQDQLTVALTELRELIQGIHPRLLTDRGLAVAVADVADRSAIPVEVEFELPYRLPDPIEATAYFMVCEALANVAKHSGADRVSVHGRLAADRLIIEVRDDGRGGIDVSRGTGLTGMRDRLAVLDGTLAISSPEGGPTLLRMEIPMSAPRQDQHRLTLSTH